MAHIGIRIIRLHLRGCESLKEKRQRLGRLRDRFGREPGIAVCESDFQDSWNQAEWTFLAIAADGVVVERALAGVERFIREEIDAAIIDIQRESL